MKMPRPTYVERVTGWLIFLGCGALITAVGGAVAFVACAFVGLVVNDVLMGAAPDKSVWDEVAVGSRILLPIVIVLGTVYLLAWNADRRAARHDRDTEVWDEP